MSDPLRPHELNHGSLPCPSPSPWIYSNSHPLSWWCRPTILSSAAPFFSCLQSFLASVFSNKSAVGIRWPISSSIISSNEYSGLIYFRIDWFDLFAVQGTLKSLFQHHSSKTSVLWWSAFFMVQLLRPYMTTGKTIALITQTSASKVMSLLFNMVSRFVIASLPRGKRVLILWLQSPSAVILEPKKRKSVTTFTASL